MNVVRLATAVAAISCLLANPNLPPAPKQTSSGPRLLNNPKILLDSDPNSTPKPRALSDSVVQAYSADQLDYSLSTAMARQGASPIVVIINEVPMGGGAAKATTTLGLSDVDDLLVLADHLSTSIDAFYKLVPSADSLTYNATMPTLDRIKAGVNLYLRLRQLVSTAVEDRAAILADIELVDAKAYALKITQNDMLRFYDLAVDYQLIKQRSAPFAGTDVKFGAYWAEVSDMGLTFSTDVKAALTSIATFVTSLDSFAKALKVLLAYDYSATISLSTLSLVDSAITALYDLLKIKIDIETTFKSSRQGLLSLQAYRARLKETLNNIDLLVDYHQMKGSALQVQMVQQNMFEYHSSAGKLSLFLTLFLALII